MTSLRRLPAAALALAACLAVAGCGGGSSSSGGGGSTLDPSRPDDALLIQGLQRYDAANALAASARALADPTARAAREAEAAAEYAAARGLFARLLVEFPASPRTDNAAYLEGRCAYELGTITGARADFEEARALLAAAFAAHPTSPLQDSVTYFCGRALFRLAELDASATGATTAPVRALYAEAWTWFDRSARANAAGTWGDNAAYYRGRCDFEVGLLDLNPLEVGAVPPLPGSAAWLEAIARLDRAEAELAAVPAASSYFDNARYYLGRSHFEEPTDAAATRIASLEAAIAAFDAVPAGSPYAEGARYWRGRSRYALAARLGVGSYAEAPLLLALADLKAVAAGSTYRDNALHWAARAYLQLVPPACAIDRPGDAAPASACAVRAILVATAASSPYVPLTADYFLTAGCTCP